MPVAALLLFLPLLMLGCLDIEGVRDRYADAGPLCDDDVRNGDETDVDCGGDTCGPCAVPLRCDQDADCLSGLCLQSQCTTPRCGDRVVSGDEECDSAGVNTPTCNADCTRARCDDGNQNQDESDMDCGGVCAACADGRGCNDAADCQSSSCVASSCASAMCGDGVPNGGEPCDPGPTSNATCDADCTAPECQDGFYNSAAGEGCDDGNDVARDGCGPDCQVEASITYTFTGNVETYVVPPGVTAVHLLVLGATGGPDGTNPTATGGRGGRAEGTLSVTPGDVLYMRVGEAGGASTVAFNGGTGGGALCWSGGGASDVRRNGQELTDRVVVGGGGGGGGVDPSGGRGGGLAGTAAESGGSCQAANVGEGATQGAGGGRGGSTSDMSTDGALGVGGACGGLAGGGGGGYYGGGGGNSLCGGGGGSSYIGGLTGGTTDVGVHDGHGSIVLTVM